MKKITAIAAILLILSALWGCSDTPTGDAARFAELEARVEGMRAEFEDRDARIMEELIQIKANLESIHKLLEIEEGRKRMHEGTPPDEELDAKAKSFVNKNLERLMDLTKKLLDKMEKELDESFKSDKPAQPKAPKGAEI